MDYTITVENTGKAAYTAEEPATFTDALSAVLDDATYNDDAAADVGTVSYSEPELSWSGPLQPGQTATITYSMTVNDPPTGNGNLANGVVGPPESNCDDGTEDECRVVLPDRSLSISKTADPTDEVLPGETVEYTVTVENTGQVPYTANRPATFTDDLTKVLDDATYNNDGAADTGTVSYAEPKLSWSGPLAPGQTATITYSRSWPGSTTRRCTHKTAGPRCAASTSTGRSQCPRTTAARTSCAPGSGSPPGTGDTGTPATRGPVIDPVAGPSSVRVVDRPGRTGERAQA